MVITNKQLERLSIFSETCNQVYNAIHKVINYGEADDNLIKNHLTNKEDLSRKIGELLFCIEFCLVEGDLDLDEIEFGNAMKIKDINSILKYNIINTEEYEKDLS